MATPQIAFVHIPKSAGTAIRFLFAQEYGDDKVFWWPRNDGTQNKSDIPIHSSHWRVCGGHLPVTHFSQGYKLFLSVTRNPIDRIYSLFSYLTRPHDTTETVFKNARQLELQKWLENGIVPGDILKSLTNCEAFSQLVCNAQCKMLSRYSADLEGVIQTLSEEDCIVGSHAHLPLFLAQIGKALQLSSHQIPRLNTSSASSNARFSEKEAKHIRQLCNEDIKLDHWIQQKHHGLFENATKRKVIEYFLPPKPSYTQCTFEAWQHISLASNYSTISIEPEKSVDITITIHNNSDTTLSPFTGKGLHLVYQIYCSTGATPIHTSERFTILETIEPHTSTTQIINIKLPKKLHSEASYIQVDVVVEGKYWASKSRDLECLEIPLLPI